MTNTNSDPTAVDDVRRVREKFAREHGGRPFASTLKRPTALRLRFVRNSTSRSSLRPLRTHSAPGTGG